ncbi:histidine kinase [Bacillus sp. UFRGS-B20]|nr:histidine kinase [Bacillus sp. UFRGS-B20]
MAVMFLYNGIHNRWFCLCYFLCVHLQNIVLLKKNKEMLRIFSNY